MPRLLCAAVLALGFGALVGAQTSTTESRFTGCLQRTPSNLEKEGRFMLMNASNSPLGGATEESTTAVPPPQRGAEPIERRPGESDARQETGGVSYVLQGGSNLESMVGQRVEVTGAIAGEVRVPPTRPTTKQPTQKLRVTRVRAIAATCNAA